MNEDLPSEFDLIVVGTGTYRVLDFFSVFCEGKQIFTLLVNLDFPLIPKISEFGFCSIKLLKYLIVQYLN